jgi:predicted transposase YbfD/YdcC
MSQLITEQGGDYILSLKGNQGSIHQDVDVQQLFDWALKTNWENIAHEVYQTINKGHGRIEIRRYWLVSSVEHLIDAHLWSGLKRVGLIESERRINYRVTSYN